MSGFGGERGAGERPFDLPLGSVSSLLGSKTVVKDENE